ncbi:hypothetical protein V6N13_108181 [Hibiscus sabdariffa]
MTRCIVFVFFMDIKILCWNVQGCGHWRFLPTAKQFMRDNKPDMVVFVEPRISGVRANSLISSLGFPNSHRVESRGFSGGIWIACPTKSNRKLLWPHLRRLATSIKSPCILFGDFNATLNTTERLGCALSAKPSIAFQNLLFDYGLCDMGYIGLDFTWSRGAVQVRLDRFICNSYWDEDFPESSVHHLLRLRSDHRPILLHVGPIRHASNSGQFHYFTGWQWTHGIKRFLAILVQRSGLLWPVSEGDHNTRYFHRLAVNRKQRNKITTFKLSEGTWCDDLVTLQDEATRYFASLFSKDIAPQLPV